MPFIDQVQAAQEEHKVSDRKAEFSTVDIETGNSKQLVGHMNKERSEAEEHNARNQRAEQTELATDMLFFGRKSIAGKNDEH